MRMVTEIQKAINVMENRYSEALNTQDIADIIGVQRSYFSTLFKAQTGLSPYRYFMQLRIRKACALLKDSDMAVAEVAETVGLNAQNFSRTFKREKGVTPREYRNSKK